MTDEQAATEPEVPAAQPEVAAEPPEVQPEPEAAAGPPEVQPEVVADTPVEIAGSTAAEAGEGAPADTPNDSTSTEASEGGEREGASPLAEPLRKKRRRRRRKKKPAQPGAEGEAPAAAPSAEGRPEGAPSDEEAASEGDDDERPKKPHRKPERERPAFNVGDEVFGLVTEVTRTAIWIDVAGKAVGIYDREQLIQVPPRPGEKFTAKVKSISTRGGALMLGPEPWDPAIARGELRAAQDTETPIECWVTGIIKGGLEVDYKGVRAFAPASHVELRPGADLLPLFGEKLPFFVSHYAKKGRDVVVSRKRMLEEEHQKVRGELLAKVVPDTVTKGVVRNVLVWGAFVSLPELGGLEGVIHMSEASHDRGARLTDVLHPGEEIDVKILRVDDKGKLWLSRKAVLEDPWERAKEKYPVGSIQQGTVVRLTDFGAFVQLEPGMDGLCHVADISYQHVDHPKEVVQEGNPIEVVIVAIDSKARKVTLHPAPPAEERALPRVKVVQYAHVKAVVMQIRETGLGVRILGVTGRAQRGFIPSGQTGTPRGTDLRKNFPIGKEIEVKVLEFDPRRGEARLSIRALSDDAEKQAYRDYRKKVAREATFGTLGDLLKKR